MKSDYGKRVKVTCKYCGKVVEVHPYRVKTFGYCSTSCCSKANPKPVTKVEKTCEYCGKTFLAYYHVKDKARFCSASCRSKFTAKKGEASIFWKGGQGKSICKHCGKEFTNTGNNPNNYCSKACLDQNRMRRIETVCVGCGKHIEKRLSKFAESKLHFCSQECAKAFMVGENSPLWFHGVRDYPATFNRKFKDMIRERDNYTCAICKEYGNEVHHVNYVKTDTVPENCITLCKSCHCKTNHSREHWMSILTSRE